MSGPIQFFKRIPHITKMLGSQKWLHTAQVPFLEIVSAISKHYRYRDGEGIKCMPYFYRSSLSFSTDHTLKIQWKPVQYLVLYTIDFNLLSNCKSIRPRNQYAYGPAYEFKHIQSSLALYSLRIDFSGSNPIYLVSFWNKSKEMIKFKTNTPKKGKEAYF